MTFARGQYVTARNQKHGTVTGQIAVMSTNGDSLGVLLDEPIKTYSREGLFTGALLLLRINGEYRDFWDNTWILSEAQADV